MATIKTRTKALPESIFHSPSSNTQMKLEQVVEDLLGFFGNVPYGFYRLIIGTDSSGRQAPGGQVEFVTAIVVHRVGHGGRYWWTKTKDSRFYPLQARIYREADLSVKLAQELLKLLQGKLGELYNREQVPQIEIHTDIGRQGRTRDLIREVVGMIQGNGFEARIKPEAYGAAIVADRYT
jgi:hypothetical protein